VALSDVMLRLFA